MGQITLSGTFVTVTCCRADCAVTFALSQGLYGSLIESHGPFLCPHGHSQYFPAESPAEQAVRIGKETQAQLARERAAHDQTREALRHEERKRAATRGHLTRVKKRVGAGVCPCCNRTFAILTRHMQTQHPEFKEASA